MEIRQYENLNSMAEGVSHHFNNLLMVILGNAELIQTELNDESPLRERVKDIETAARRAAVITQKLAFYSDDGRFVKQRVNLGEIIRDMDVFFKESIPSQVSLNLQISENTPDIDGDVRLLRQLVSELVSNAADAMDDRKGPITIGVKTVERAKGRQTHGLHDRGWAQATEVQLEIKDAGCGMNEKTRSRMFDPFFSTKFTGRGLGLATALKIVRGHGGRIDVQSQRSKGTAVKILFPALAKRNERKKEKTTRFEEEKPERTVLVVDEDKIVLSVVKRMLERKGYAVLTARTGRDAIGQFREKKERIGCVLLDYKVASAGVGEVISELRGGEKDIPVFILSGYKEGDIDPLFQGEKPAGFIQKPFDSERLLEKMGDLLGV